jgi:hypothetical protein
MHQLHDRPSRRDRRRTDEAKEDGEEARQESHAGREEYKRITGGQARIADLLAMLGVEDVELETEPEAVPRTGFTASRNKP